MVHPDRLATWGEIAEFLRVDVKTAQRWERERGLPVHRLPGGRRGQVHAYRAELERWLAGREAPTQAAPIVIPPLVKSRPTRRLLLAGIAGAGLVPAGWFGVSALRRLPRIATATIEAGILVALDHDGRALWRYSFDGVSPRPVEGESGTQDFLRTVDFRGDGHPDLLAAIRRGTGGEVQDTLYCFDSKGKIRWSWKASPPLLDFNGQPFEPSWTIRDMLVTRRDGKASLWVAVSNPFRWASALLQVSAGGQASVQFANAGWIMEMLSVDGPEGTILAAGINNAFATPFLALIGEQDPPCSSPAGGPPRYRYENGPVGPVRKYVLLPRSEFVRGASADYLIPRYLGSLGGGYSIKLIANRQPGEVYIYSFDRDLRPVKVRPAYGFNVIHQELQRERLIDHSEADCPELHKPHVLRCWTPGDEWTEMEAPVAHRANLL